MQVKRFPGRTHLVWIEPEGLDSDVAYPNGITMGFPEDIQREVVASIPGKGLGFGVWGLGFGV